MLAPRSLGLAACLALALPAWSQTPPAQSAWVLDSAGLNWRAEHVRLGNHGTAIFHPATLNNSRDMLLSRHDADPPTPVWQALTAPSQVSSSAAADETDCYVVLSRTPTAVLNEDEWRLRRYDSAGLAWTYQSPFLGAGRSFVGVDRAGTRIVTVIGNPLIGTNELSIFDPDSSTPILQYALPSGTIWNGSMASDGSRLALALGQGLYVVDVVSGAILFQETSPFQMSLVGLGLSGDGAVLVTGSNSPIQAGAYTWNGSAYQLEFTSSWIGESRTPRVAVSEDGGTVALASFGGLPGTETVRLEIRDVASHRVLALEQLDSPGWSVENIPVAVDLSADGAVVALAISGDSGELWDELRFYQRHSGVPIATIPVTGEPSSLDLSSDGHWAAVGIDSFPQANTTVQLYRLGTPDLALYGTPSLGSDPQVELRSASSGPAFLVVAQAPLATPVVYPVAGELLVDPSGAIQLPFQSGSSSMRLHLPTDPALVGTEVWIQGLSSRPWSLTEVAFPIVLLP